MKVKEAIKELRELRELAQGKVFSLQVERVETPRTVAFEYCAYIQGLGWTSTSNDLDAVMAHMRQLSRKHKLKAKERG